MRKSTENSKAAPQPCRRWEAAGWRASHNLKKKVLMVLWVL